MFEILSEATFNIQKQAKGTVNFPSSSFTDPHIKKAIQHLSKSSGVSESQIIGSIQRQVDEFHEIADKVPLLYDTIRKNIIEQTLFGEFERLNTSVPGAPKFNNVIFTKLTRILKAEYDEFFPLRGFIDKRYLIHPKISFVEEKPVYDNEGKSHPPPNAPDNWVPTAAATPTGEFIFNVPFMQNLLDYAHIKGIKPNDKKYESHGGPIPDEYAYIEFLIMHEFMHYSNDDFYYQKIIPKANGKIINWVGDFRTNYLLVKSGKEPLPIGLYNDSINYDRQKEYAEMYRLVKEEFDKLKPPEQKSLEDLLNKLSDDHSIGEQQGQESDVTSEDGDMDDIERNADRIGKSIDEEKDVDPNEAIKKGDGELIPGQRRDNEPGKKAGKGYEVDYSKIKPTFNWKQLIQLFIASMKPKSEETYEKPHRRSVSSIDTIRQVGAAAIKPAERTLEIMTDLKLAFLIDSSGSMGNTIKTVFSNITKLLSVPIYGKSAVIVMEFDVIHNMYKVIYAQNKGAKVSSHTEKPKKWPINPKTILSVHRGGGTELTPAIAADALKLLADRYNIIMFLDRDCMWDVNYNHVLNILKTGPRQVFIVFDSRDTYIEFRKKTGFSTKNITYFE